MGNHVARRRRTFRFPDRILAVLSLGVVLGLGAVGTSAYWTDQATVTGGTITAGRLNLKVGNPAVENDPPQFTTDFAMTNMIPGSSKDALLKVTNAGTTKLTYTVTASATNAGAGADQLGSAIRITVLATNCSGTVLQSSVAPSAVSVNRSTPLIAGASEDLCFRATLPANADTALQGATTVVTLTLNAVQAP